MTKIDLDKFIASLVNYMPNDEDGKEMKKVISRAKYYYPVGAMLKIVLKSVLRKQGLMCEDGQIVGLKETKFYVGDFVKHTAYPEETYIVKAVDSAGDYELESVDGVKGKHIASATKEYLKLWTIEDAREGDVLCTYECEEPKIVFILANEKVPYSCVCRYHCYYNMMYPKFETFEEKHCIAPKKEDLRPATKEQRDILFEKIKEAGYEWRANGKCLMKSEREPKEMSPFEIRLGEILCYAQRAVIEHGFNGEDIINLRNTFGAELMKLAEELVKQEMPKWKHCEPSFFSYTDNSVEIENRMNYAIGSGSVATSYLRLRKGNYYIPISELDKLPKE